MEKTTADAPRADDPARGDASRPLLGRPIRVAMVASMFPPSIGGIQSHTLRLGQKLAASGLDVHVVTRIQPGLASFERMGGVRVHRVGIASARGAAGSAAFIADALRVLLLLRHDVDVIHAHQLLSPATVGLLAAPLVGVPLVVNPHACGAIGDVGVLSSSAIGRLRLRAAVTRADAIVAVSRTIRDELITAGAAPHRVWVITNGVDTDHFSPAGPEERRMLRALLQLPETPLVVYTGRLAPEKGVDVLLASWPRLLERVPGAHLWVVGTGSDERGLRAQARALRIDRSVEFAGGLADVAPVVRAADLAVVASRTEGMPVAVLEAMSCGIPIVATRVGGSAELVEDGVTGRLVPPDDPATLAAAMADVLLDRGAAGRMAEAGRALILEHHAMDLVARRFASLYRTLDLRRRAGAAPAVAGRGSP